MVDFTDPKIKEQFRNIFFPYASAEGRRMKENQTRFCHYTSAHVGLEIIRNEEIWLRNSLLMNDSSEIEHGSQLLDQVRKSDLWERLGRALAPLNGGLVEQVWDDLISSQAERRKNTYILSLSEHARLGREEDKYGRLSMWRAYGGKTNVALLFKPDIFFSETDALSAFTSPVLYADESTFVAKFADIVKNIEENSVFVKSIGPEVIQKTLSWALHFAILSTKHPGFSEEHEWRVLYSPNSDQNGRVQREFVTLDGIPQQICKIPLQNNSEVGLNDIDVATLIEKIIIGPTEHPSPIADAYVAALKAEGVRSPETRIVISEIPLRR